MEPIDLINQAIDYMENNLTEPIRLENISAVGGYSRFHFCRLFVDLTGETPAGYLRKRRLSEAARELVNSKKPILNIALDYQFQSQEAFTRSFKRRFRISPGIYRKRRYLARIFSRITLDPSRKHLIYFQRGDAQEEITPRPGLGLIRRVYPCALFTYQTQASLAGRKFDQIYLLL